MAFQHLPRQRLRLDEIGRAQIGLGGVSGRVDTIEHQRVEVDVEVQRGTEALDDVQNARVPVVKFTPGGGLGEERWIGARRLNGVVSNCTVRALAAHDGARVVWAAMTYFTPNGEDNRLRRARALPIGEQGRRRTLRRMVAVPIWSALVGGANVPTVHHGGADADVGRDREAACSLSCARPG